MSASARERASSDVRAQLDTLLVVRLWALLDTFEQRLAHELSALDLSVASFRLIGELMRSPDGLAQSELARRLGVRPPTVSAAISKLQKAGIVERRSNPDDARAYLVFLCPTAPLARGAQLLERLEAELVDELDACERAQLSALLDRASERLARTRP